MAKRYRGTIDAVKKGDIKEEVAKRENILEGRRKLLRIDWLGAKWGKNWLVSEGERVSGENMSMILWNVERPATPPNILLRPQQ